MSLVDQHGRPLAPAVIARRLVDPVFDPRVEAGPRELGHVRSDAFEPGMKQALLDEVARARVHMDADTLATMSANFDGFVNLLTGVGTTWGDKTMGGLPGGPNFCLYRIHGWEAELRTRGSDLGYNIVGKRPDEMTREGWDVEVQPTEDEQDIAASPQAQMDACLHEPHRAAAAWRREAEKRWQQSKRIDDAVWRCWDYARRWDAFGAQPPPSNSGQPRNGAPPNGVQARLGAQPPAPAPATPLPKINDEGLEVARLLEKWTKKVDAVAVFNQALKYERQNGGGAILIGVDDGKPLTEPLDPKDVRKVTHLTAFTGGWDGEVVAWRPYNDPRKPKYGLPEIYQVRNLSVSLARPPAPGEGPVQQLVPQGPSGPTIFYVHESRLIVFDGKPVSRQARQEMFGWGDSVYTRVNKVLSDFDQTWGAVAILMQELSIWTMSIEGYTMSLVSRKPSDQDALLQRARDMHLMRGAARMNIIDSKDKVERTNVSLAGVAEILDGPLVRRLAAAADMPVSLLFGQVQGALGGDAGSTETRYFYDSVRSEQNNRLVPALEMLYEIVLRSKEGPTRGKVPERWNVVMRPLWQPTPQEKAQTRLTTAQADQIEISQEVVTPEEVAATRYGGADYNPGPIMLDLAARERASQAMQEQPETAGAAGAPAGDRPDPGEGFPGGPEGAQHQPPSVASPPSAVPERPIIPAAPPMTAMPIDPITAAPSSVISTIHETGANGRSIPAKPAE